MPRIVAAPMTLLMPGAGPPPTKIPMIVRGVTILACPYRLTQQSSSFFMI
jgi:hypothetical protein